MNSFIKVQNEGNDLIYAKLSQLPSGQYRFDTFEYGAWQLLSLFDPKEHIRLHSVRTIHADERSLVRTWIELICSKVTGKSRLPAEDPEGVLLQKFYNTTVRIDCLFNDFAQNPTRFLQAIDGTLPNQCRFECSREHHLLLHSETIESIGETVLMIMEAKAMEADEIWHVIRENIGRIVTVRHGNGVTGIFRNEAEFWANYK